MQRFGGGAAAAAAAAATDDDGDDDDAGGVDLGNPMAVKVSTMSETATADARVRGEWAADEGFVKAAEAGDRPALEAALRAAGAAAAGRLLAQRDELGRTALHWAADRGHAAIVELLLARTAAAAAGDGAAAAAATAPSAVVDARDADGMTPLWNAVMCEHAEVVAALVRHGADVNAADEDGDTPLSSASAAIRGLLLAPS